MAWSKLFVFLVVSTLMSCAPFINESYCESEEDYVLSEHTEGFWYGNGLGIAAVNVGATITYPPYVAYLLGNGAIEYLGYEKVEITDVLPESAEQIYDQFYYGVTSIPGRVNAHVIGVDFKSPQDVKENIARYRHFLHSNIEYARW